MTHRARHLPARRDRLPDRPRPRRPRRRGRRPAADRSSSSGRTASSICRATLSDGGARRLLGRRLARRRRDARLVAGRGSTPIPKGAAIAETSVLVEDFEPERLAFDLTTDADGRSARATPVEHRPRRPLSLRRDRARPLDRRRHRRPPADTPRRLPRLPLRPRRRPGRARRASRSTSAPTTDEDGKATLEVDLPELPATTKPLDGEDHRPPHRHQRPRRRAPARRCRSSPTAPRIGIKPLFDDDVPRKARTADFDVIAVGAGRRAHRRDRRRPGRSSASRPTTSGTAPTATGATSRSPAPSASPTARSTPPPTARSRDLRPRSTGATTGSRSSATATSRPRPASSSTPAGTSPRPAPTRPTSSQVALDKPAYRVGDTAQAPPRPALRRHRADHGRRRPADRHADGRRARRTAPPSTSTVTDAVGPRRLCHGHALPADGPRRRSGCRRAPSASPGPRSSPATATSTSSLDVADEMRPRGPMTIPVAIANLEPGDRGLSSRSPRSISASSTSPTSSRRRRTTGTSASASSASRSATSTAC